MRRAEGERKLKEAEADGDVDEMNKVRVGLRFQGFRVHDSRFRRDEQGASRVEVSRSQDLGFR
jgi:hypothetical protein